MTEHGQKTDSLLTFPLSRPSKMRKNLVEAVRQCKEPLYSISFRLENSRPGLESPADSVT